MEPYKINTLGETDSTVVNQLLQMSSRVIPDTIFTVSLFMLLFLRDDFVVVFSTPMFFFP